MKIRFGYVAMSLELENASPSKTITYTNFQKLKEKDQETAMNKLRRITRENLHNCYRLLLYNKAYDIEVFRFSSKIIPLGTHPELKEWDYIGEMKDDLKKLGDFIKENKMRVTFHPDHFTVLNTPHKEKFEKSLYYLDYHHKLFNAMGLSEDYYKFVIHLGGAYKDKSAALERFVENWDKVPVDIQKRITLENDDKIYTASDILTICKKINVPMIFDIHHFRCNHEENEELENIAPEFIKTWENTNLPPKIHVSSPKSEKNRTGHHDFINKEDIYPFIKIMKKLDIDFDVMVEAKQKDRAMFKLVDDLQNYEDIEKLGDAAVKV